jgi:glycosyltransferase involved in cell wall biosynthesis
MRRSRISRERLSAPGERYEERGWPWGDLPSRTNSVAGDSPLPAISIVIPSFNQAAFLEETLRSILLQAYPRLELIVQDGGSQDGSVEILKRYAPWLAHWQSEPDGGQSDAINQGFQRATGDVITFFSSDDLYLPGALSEIARLWSEAPRAGAYVGAFQFMDEASRPVSETVLPRLPGPAPLDLATTDPGAWRLHQVATFYRREALDEVGRWVRPELRYTMDRELLYRICRRFPVATTQALLARFRRHGASKSGAEMLPFCREMASLHLLAAPAGEGAEVRRLRRRFVRHWRARGFLKLARATSRPGAAAGALLRAAAVQPSLLLRPSYGRFWLEALGLRRPAAPLPEEAAP